MTIPPLAPASTVALIRPAAGGLEVFMVKRHTAVAVLAGAYVFPGGQLALADSAGDIAALCDGLGGVRDRMAGVLDDEARAFHVAAVRELYEEAGILLARNRDGKAVGERSGDIDAVDKGREALAAGRPFADAGGRGAVAPGARLAHAVRALGHTGHRAAPLRRLLLPGGRTRGAGRVALRPRNERGRLDAAGRRDRPLPGRRDRAAPAHLDDAAAARAVRLGGRGHGVGAHRRPVPRIQPGFGFQGTTRIVTLPGDPALAPVPGFAAKETRFALENGRWRPIESL